MKQKIDLMIVGAQKAGTTSLLRYLGEHPSCVSHPQKEFGYFLKDVDYALNYDNAFEKYYKEQTVSPEKKLVAKSATLYTSENAIKRLYEHNPHCEIVLILRNPADRCYSSYQMEKNAGSVSYEFDQIGSIISKGEGWEYDVFIDFGIYARHINTLFKYFPPAQVSIFLFEDLKQDAPSVCRKLFARLGVDPEFIPDTTVRHNETRLNRSSGYAKTVNRVLQSNSTFRKIASHFIPGHKSYKFGNVIRGLNKSKETYPPMKETTRFMLNDFFRPYNRELGILLNKDLDSWSRNQKTPGEQTEAPGIQYRFRTISACNLCEDPGDKHRILGKRLNKSQGRNPRKKTGITTTIMQCGKCGLIYCNPLPVPLDIQDHYGVPPESYWQSTYFEPEPGHFEGELRMLRTLLPEDRWNKALDIGAGLGKTMMALGKAGFDCYGIEPSRSFYERALARMQIHPDKLSLGMIEGADYPEAQFDFITFGAVLEHLYDPAEALKKALKWLKPGGIIHIEVPSSAWLIHKLVNFYYRRIKFSDYVANLSPMHPPYHLYEFGLESFRAHGRMNKYEVVKHQYYVCETYLPKYLDAALKLIMRHTDTGMQLCVWLKKN